MRTIIKEMTDQKLISTLNMFLHVGVRNREEFEIMQEVQAEISNRAKHSRELSKYYFCATASR